MGKVVRIDADETGHCQEQPPPPIKSGDSIPSSARSSMDAGDRISQGSPVWSMVV
jgi:hypothetical protein